MSFVFSILIVANKVPILEKDIADGDQNTQYDVEEEKDITSDDDQQQNDEIKDEVVEDNTNEAIE